jgi:alanine-glyoxylate transaminase/serine-glyoxylate transaminase/serine-pyruvate transaminase
MTLPSARQATRPGRPFLQIPGPTNVPERVLRAMNCAVIDHRGPEFAELTREILPHLRIVFGTREGAVLLYPASGTGAWEAALVNVLKPGDRVLTFSSGYFSAGFAQTARNLGFGVDEVPLRWGEAVTFDSVQRHLRADTGHDRYRAVLVVHNETSTGVLSDVAAIRRAMDDARHEALLIVDAVSSLASVAFCFDEWGVDVALAGSQKGLMMPPGLAVLCASHRARIAAERGGSPRNYFDWRPILRDNAAGFFPYTPATLMLFGLREALRMLVEEEGLDAVFRRHHRLASGVRAAVAAWDLPLVGEDPACASPTITAVVVPNHVKSGDVIKKAREHFALSLGVGLGQLKDRAFRIGHLGSLNELEVLGTVAGIEMTLDKLELDVAVGSGVKACQMSFLAGRVEAPPQTAKAGRRSPRRRTRLTGKSAKSTDRNATQEEARRRRREWQWEID